MKRIDQLQERISGPLGQARHAGKFALPLLPIAMLLSACGSGSGDVGDGGPPNQPAPLLQVGMQRQYAGTATRTVVYADPTTTSPNNTLAYSFTENQSVLQAPAGAPAFFDVHTDYAYTITQDPGVGTVPVSQSVDTYENLLVSGASQMVTSLGQAVVTVSGDETSNLLGNGPYTETTTTSSTFPTPRDNFPYPLQAGATLTVPQSAVETISFTDVNTSGAAPSNGSNVGYSDNRTENDDGSFSYLSTYVNGNTFSRTQNSDGSGSQVFTSATSTTATTVGLPAVVGGVNTIPVEVTVTTTSPTTTDYSAADWYPANGVPNAPLVLESRSVVGPASLPPECNGALQLPGIYEVDTTTTSLGTIGTSYSVTTTQNFSAANGATVCTISSETQSAYDLQTGALVSTTTTNTVTQLTGINY